MIRITINLLFNKKYLLLAKFKIRNMKKLAFAFFALFFSVLSYAQIEGKWKTIDDETGKPKSIVEIFKNQTVNIMAKLYNYYKNQKITTV